MDEAARAAEAEPEAASAGVAVAQGEVQDQGRALHFTDGRGSPDAEGIALLAAIFGLVDLFLGVPREERATRNTGIIHLGLNVATTVLFAGAAFSLYAQWRSADAGELAYGLPLVVGLVGLALMIAAGFFGWKLVQTHHVGIEDPAGDAPRSADLHRAIDARSAFAPRSSQLADQRAGR